MGHSRWKAAGHKHRLVTGRDLGVMIRGHRALRLVVLNACEGARSAQADPFGGVAQALVRQGIPAVIAMQFEISDPAALVFSHSFYQAIADGLPVDLAVVEARIAMLAEGNEVEWATPCSNCVPPTAESLPRPGLHKLTAGPARQPSPGPGRKPSPGPGRKPSPGPGRTPSPGPGRQLDPGPGGVRARKEAHRRARESRPPGPEEACCLMLPTMRASFRRWWTRAAWYRSLELAARGGSAGGRLGVTARPEGARRGPGQKSPATRCRTCPRSLSTYT